MDKQNDRRRRDGAGGTTRRQFLRATAAAGVAAAAASVTIAESRNPNSRLGVGFIGCGGRQHAHLRSVNWLKTQAKEPVDIVAACDVYRPRMEQVAKAYGAKGYMDHRELLADPNVDVVAIATPDRHHGYQAIDAAKAGKDIYCEKPFTHWQQFDLAKKVVAEVEKHGRIFQLGTQGMSDSAWHQAAKLVKDGLIGRPIHAECGYFRVGDWGERGMPIPDKNAKPGKDLNWEAFLGDAPKRPFDISRFFRWRMYEDYAGGPVTDLFPHSLTPVVFMMDAGLPSIAVATGGKFRYQQREVPDTFNMLVDYPRKMTIAVLGTQGNSYQDASHRGAGGRSPIIRGWEGTLTFERTEIVFTPISRRKKPRRFKIEHGESVVDHWKNLLNCIRSRNPKTNSPVRLAYEVQTALIMAMLAFRAGRTAKFDAEKEQIVV
ncbi:MAG: Gfo/Idh/MocA family oxidoreductase [Planctomycetes bacterium]|nr:Gfo/Idh/MocA family oxidoreductase [Planctomycetota bacterium]